METYQNAIEEMAKDFVEEYKDELKEIIKENKDETPDYIFDEMIYQKWDVHDKIHEWLDSAWYGFLREKWCDECKSELMSCTKVLEESEEVETDSGLWEGQEPEKTIQTQAFFTAKNDFYFGVEKLIKRMIEKDLR